MKAKEKQAALEATFVFPASLMSKLAAEQPIELWKREFASVRQE